MLKRPTVYNHRYLYTVVVYVSSLLVLGPLSFLSPGIGDSIFFPQCVEDQVAITMRVPPSSYLPILPVTDISHLSYRILTVPRVCMRHFLNIGRLIQIKCKVPLLVGEHCGVMPSCEFHVAYQFGVS